jgi:DNA-directed RNA polymerase specialized sigma24 family protein
MSAALQLPVIWAARTGSASLQPQLIATAVNHIQKQQSTGETNAEIEVDTVDNAAEPTVTYAFYRKHTENLLRRYLYASLQVGRSPNLLGESIGRGWVSSRRVRTFEDALIFVLDVERCLNRLSAIDRQLISRIVLQEYTQAEAAALVGLSVRSVCTKLPQAIDRLTESLVKADLLILPG